MTNAFFRIFSILALVVACSLAGCATYDSSSIDAIGMTDEEIASEVTYRLAEDDMTGDYTFGVSVEQGVTTLKGAVPRGELRMRAVAIVYNSPGVTDVIDELRRW